MPQLTIERAAAIIVFALLFALAVRVPVDSDTWWHLRSGEYTLTNGMIYADPFSSTRAGEPWINHSWGGQLIMLMAYRLGENAGLALYTAALATGGMYLIDRMSSGNVYLRAFALVIGAATAAVFWSARPQMLTFFLSAVILYILHLHKRRKTDRLWLIPVLIAVWGNLHAGFSIAFILMGGSIVGEIMGNLFAQHDPDVVPWAGVRKLILVTVVSVAALMVNPYGAQMLAVPFQTVSIGALQDYIQEWNSPNFHERQTWPFIALLLGLLGVVGAGSKKLNWTDFLLCSGTAFMALLAGRNIALFAVVATPVLTRHLDAMLTERGWILRTVKRVNPRMARLNAILVSVIMLGALAKVILTLEPVTMAEAQETYLPVRVTEHLNSQVYSGRMFNSYNWGGYLMFAVPQYPVYVDGRTDLYGDEVLTRYLDTTSAADGWRETLADEGVTFVVVEAQGSLARVLRDEPGWKLDYEDNQAVVFVKEGADGTS